MPSEPPIEITRVDIEAARPKPAIVITNAELARQRVGRFRELMNGLRDRFRKSKPVEEPKREIKIETHPRLSVEPKPPIIDIADRIQIGGETLSPRQQREILDAKWTRDLAAINDKYRDRQGWNSPIRIDKHYEQEHGGNGDIYTCLPASARNALAALGITVSEGDIVAAIGGRRAFDAQGFTNSEKIRRYLASRGDVAVGSINTPSELVSILESGSVAIFGRDAHAQMVSGAETRDGQIYLRIHNPFKTAPDLVAIDEFVGEMKRTEPNERRMMTVTKVN